MDDHAAKADEKRNGHTESGFLSRHYAYTGITAIESIGQGLPAHSNWSSKWNGLTGLPTPRSFGKVLLPGECKRGNGSH
jgi:hypothetical protein